MTNSQELEHLKASVFTSFDSLPFPRFGLKAARAMDDWVSDEKVLIKITLETDIQGEWWEIPDLELKTYASDAICYLEAEGVLFYLPAYLNHALNTLTYSAFNTVIYWMTPWDRANSEDEEDFQEMYSLFRNKFSKLTDDQRQVCKSVLRYFVKNARSIKGDDFFKESAVEAIQALLKHDYWRD